MTALPPVEEPDYSKNNPRAKIVCAAQRHRDTNQLLVGARHFDKVMQATMTMAGHQLGHWAGSEDGFIDQFGNFYNRQEAYLVAERQGQYKPWGHHIPGVLYSEDLY